MARKDIEEKAEALLEQGLAMEGIEVVDVEYVRERDWILRIFIDKDGGVSLDDCQQVSEEAGRLLDEQDLIPDNYMLEVSSPGLDRVLKKDKDFRRYVGENIDIKLYAPLDGAAKGEKTMTARLLGLADTGDLLLSLQDGQEITLKRDKISQARLHFSF